jgi:CRISPR-associated protein Csh1
MIEVIREIGEYALNQIGIKEGDYIPLLAEEPGLEFPGEYMVIIIDIVEDGFGAHFDKIDLIPFDSYKKDNLLYKPSPSPKSPDFAPTTKITKDKDKKSFKIDTSFQGRIIKWFKNCKNEQINKIGKCIESNSEQIYNKLKDFEFNLKKDYLLTIRINDQYLGEIPEFQKVFNENFSDKCKVFNGKKVYNLSGICSLCGKRGEVFGNISPYTWYSLDKECYIAGGFSVKDAWRNFSTCRDCALQLEAGKTYIYKYLDKRFAGVQFMLLPHLILGGIDRLGEILNIYELFDKRRFSMADDQRIIADEDEIWSIASSFEDYVTFNLIFYEKEQERRRILLSLEDIYPSRLRHIFETKDKVNEIKVFTQNDIRFDFRLIKGIIHSTGDSVREFLNYISRIFKGSPISYYTFISQASKNLRDAFVNNKWDMRSSSLSAFMCLLYIQELELFYDRKEVTSMTNHALSIDGMDRIESFFTQFGNAFNSPAKKGVFLLGVLTQNLLDIQYRQTGGSTPFRKRLKGLKMHKEDILGLLPAIQNKLEEYDSNYYRHLESVISHYLLEAQSDWDLNMDEISFYFVIGMNLNDAKDNENVPLFKSAKEKAE